MIQTSHIDSWLVCLLILVDIDDTKMTYRMMQGNIFSSFICNKITRLCTQHLCTFYFDLELMHGIEWCKVIYFRHLFVTKLQDFECNIYALFILTLNLLILPHYRPIYRSLKSFTTSTSLCLKLSLICFPFREVNNRLNGWAIAHLVNYFAHSVN